METLTLKSIQLKGYHGYYKEERQQGNNFEIDLTFSANLRKAGESDRLEDTIDYQQVLTVVTTIVEGPSVKLIETLAHKIGDQLFDKFNTVESLTVSVRKLHPPLDVKTAYSEITMRWPRS